MNILPESGNTVVKKLLISPGTEELDVMFTLNPVVYPRESSNPYDNFPSLLSWQL